MSTRTKLKPFDPTGFFIVTLVVLGGWAIAFHFVFAVCMIAQIGLGWWCLSVLFAMSFVTGAFVYNSATYRCYVPDDPPREYYVPEPLEKEDP